MTWRHPLVRGAALTVTALSVALMFFPERVGLPILKLPLGAQFVLGLLVVVAPLLELLARFVPADDEKP